ncbi:Nup93/Nic96-domain-containing protein [Lineolata rhizophorae]|uniref:Nup93/Nic96-domain-containing protein n=1 Tax=Lineolata rhizophorae TaxID=578093 RepID=A0A6A6P133_9PEZI|nr:Nup93/Nic96-domain-containing protein [Lineolata rhizophorae]
MFGSTFGTGGLAQPNQQQQQQQPQSNQNNLNQSQQGQAAYFDHLLERGKKRNNLENGGTQFGELPALQLGLADIARKVRNLGSGGPSAEEAKKGKTEGDSRAHYILAGSSLRDFNTLVNTVGPSAAVDTDLDGFVSNLHAQSTLDLISESLEQSKRDFDTYLEDNVQMEWDTQRKRIYQHFGLVRPDEPEPDDNQQQGAGLNGSFGASAFGRSSRRGRGPTAPTMSFGTSGMTKSVIGSPAVHGASKTSGFADIAEKVSTANVPSLPEDRFLRDKEEKFATKVRELNLARVQQQQGFPLLHGFSEVEAQAAAAQGAGTAGLKLVDAYNALVHITGEKDESGVANAIRERTYMEPYLEENPNSPVAVELRKRIVNGSRTFLEEQFWGKVLDIIKRNPREASVGGVPTPVNQVRAYIRVLLARREFSADPSRFQQMDEDYCWIVIYFFLRSGRAAEAYKYVQDNERSMRSIDRAFVSYLGAYTRNAEGRLPPELQNRINTDYIARSRAAAATSSGAGSADAAANAIDPYRLACYKIIGRCDLHKRSFDDINHDVEDWLWLQFALARESSRVEESAGDTFGLQELRSSITEIGQRHFQNATEPGSYTVFFVMQILAGMFEQAVAYLYPHNYVSAVHVSIGLAYYGLLRVSSGLHPAAAAETDLLSYTTREKPQLNFGRMVGYYTRDFRGAHSEAAVDYLALICLNGDLPGAAGQSQTALCHEALRELVLETREFAGLIGDIRADGARQRGTIERRLPLIRLQDPKEFLKTVTVQAASVADDNGRTTDAVLLFHLAEDYDAVVGILNRALAEAIAVEVGAEPIRLEPLRPRRVDAAEDAADGQAQAGAQQRGPPTNQDKGLLATLSLMTIEDPEELAKAMISLYNGHAMFYRHVRSTNRDTCAMLLQLAEAKRRVSQGRWADALDLIQGMNLLPLAANGNVDAIRHAAATFGQLPAPVARNVGHLLMWTITACGRQRELLRSSQFEDANRNAIAQQLLQTSMDLMVYAGLVKYKLPPRVFEELARAGQEAGAY